MRAAAVLLALAACGKSASGDAAVHGFVVEDSITKEIVADETVTTFALELDGKRTVVRLRGPTPDNLKAGTELRATGKLAGGTLEATKVEGGCDFLIVPETADLAPKWCKR